MNIPDTKLENFFYTADDKGGLIRHAWLDVENRRLLATDGHKAVRVNVTPADEDVSGPVPREAFDLARKELKAISKKIDKGQLPDPWLRVLCHEEAIEVENLLTNTKHLVVRPKVGEQKFPNMDKVFPTKPMKQTTCVSKENISAIAASLDGGTDLTLWLEGPESTIMLASSDGASVAVLMPMKGYSDSELVLKRGSVKSEAATA